MASKVTPLGAPRVVFTQNFTVHDLDAVAHSDHAYVEFRPTRGQIHWARQPGGEWVVDRVVVEGPRRLRGGTDGKQICTARLWSSDVTGAGDDAGSAWLHVLHATITPTVSVLGMDAPVPAPAEPDGTAVCQECSWQGPEAELIEDELTGDKACPRCAGGDYVVMLPTTGAPSGGVEPVAGSSAS